MGDSGGDGGGDPKSVPVVRGVDTFATLDACMPYATRADGAAVIIVPCHTTRGSNMGQVGPTSWFTLHK